MKKGWKILAVVLGAFASILAVGAIWIGRVADRRIEQMQKEIAALREEINEGSPVRLPRCGEALEGNAWDDYNKAFAAIPRPTMKSINDAYNARVMLEPKKLAELLAPGEAAADDFRKGTRRRQGAYPIVWEDGFTGKSPSMFDCQTLGNFAALRARHLMDEAKPREAAEVMLDTCRFAQDLATNTFMIFHWIAGGIRQVALDELRSILKSKDLSREDLLAIARELDQAAREWPDPGDAATNDALAAGYELLKPWALREPELRASIGESWRFGFSRALAEADAFDELRQLARQFAGISRQPWSEANRVAHELEERIHRGPNPLTDRLIQWSANNFQMDRELRTQLQLIRIAVRFRATGEVVALDDPFGTNLRTQRDGDRLKLWSVGPDGVDDGGSGEWKRKAGKDIVLEVSR